MSVGFFVLKQAFRAKKTGFQGYPGKPVFLWEKFISKNNAPDLVISLTSVNFVTIKQTANNF